MEKYHSIIETFRSAIFETIPDPLLVVNPDLTVLTANDAFYKHFNVKPEEVKDRSIYDIGNGQWNIPGLKILLEKVLPEKTVVENYQVNHSFPTIGERSILLNAREIKSSDFLPLDLILMTFEDVTDRKRWTDSILELNNKLQTANNALERYDITLSHDLRAPLKTILGFSKIIMSDYSSGLSGEVKEYMDRVIYNAEVMDQMITALSQLAGLSRTPMNRIPVDLSDIAEKVISQLKISEPNRNVDVNIQTHLMENVDPSLFLVVLTNILRNSWKFTRDRDIARVSFGVKEHNGKKIFFIKDNGVGFDMKYSYMLFGMFQRIPSDKRFEGTGTGLAIVKSIIDMHNGEIWADSREGVGTTIYFTVGN